MTDDNPAIRVLAVSKRTGATSERGCAVAVSYVRDGEAGTHVDWLDDFLDEYCPAVQVGSDGLGRSLRADGGVETGKSDREGFRKHTFEITVTSPVGADLTAEEIQKHAFPIPWMELNAIESTDSDREASNQ